MWPEASPMGPVQQAGSAQGPGRDPMPRGAGDSTGGTGKPRRQDPSSPTPFSVGSPPKFSSTYQSDSHSQCGEGSATPSSGRCWSPLTSLHGQRSLGRSVSQKPPTGFQRCGRRQRLALGPGGEGLSRVSRALASSPGQEVSRRPPEPQPEGQGPAALGGGGHGCCELLEPTLEPVQTWPVAWVRTGWGAGCRGCAARSQQSEGNRREQARRRGCRAVSWDPATPRTHLILIGLLLAADGDVAGTHEHVHLVVTGDAPAAVPGRADPLELQLGVPAGLPVLPGRGQCEHPPEQVHRPQRRAGHGRGG